MKIGITGGTGFVGRPLIAQLLSHGHSVLAWVRNPQSSSDLPCPIQKWDGTPEGLDLDSLRGLDVIINLAGEPVAGGRWTTESKKRIRDSRILITQSLVEGIRKLPKDSRPNTLLSASAIGYYGDRGDEELSESSTRGTGFLSEVTTEWEKSALEAEALGVRVICPRIGIVLGRNGGALEKMQPIPLGNGQQWMSWIHLQDLINLFETLITHKTFSGPINAVSPLPVRNRDFAKAHARARHWFGSIPFGPPRFLLSLGLGEMAEVVLASQRVLPKKTKEIGFKYQFAELDAALSDLENGEDEWLTWQFVPKPRSEVFSFFSRAENLETLTPPILKFKILSQSTDQVQTGTLIDYKLKIHGVPVHWRTEILDWSPEREFVDLQLKGPYRKWHHTHTFTDVVGGTLMTDRVRYQMPLGGLGKFFGHRFVRNDIQSIFKFRRSTIERLFPNQTTG